MLAGASGIPFTAVMSVEPPPTPSAFRFKSVSQRENVPSALRTMFPELRAAKLSVPVSVVVNEYVCCPLPGTAELTVLSSFAG